MNSLFKHLRYEGKQINCPRNVKNDNFVLKDVQRKNSMITQNFEKV